MKKIWQIAVATVAVLSLGLSTALTVSATEGYDANNCLSIVSEPGQMSDYVTYYHNGEAVSADQMTWVEDGVHGKALSLDGTTDYMQLGFDQMRVAQLTFATWINFRGALDPANPVSAYWQRLFTISEGDDRYFTVSPHAYDATMTNSEGQLDGLYMEYYRGDSDEDGQAFLMRSFTGARAGQSSFGLPQNEWHHIAVVSDGQYARVYVDGNPILEEILMMGIVQMYADSMVIGGGRWNDPLLNAALDDTMLFDRALSASEIASLMQTGDPAQLSGATTASVYLPTEPATTTFATQSVMSSQEEDISFFGIPLWRLTIVFQTVGVLFVLFVVLTVIVNIYEAKWRKAHPVEKATETAASSPDSDAPHISIKEAAKRKRQQERAAFLSEEEKEQAASQQERGDRR